VNSVPLLSLPLPLQECGAVFASGISMLARQYSHFCTSKSSKVSSKASCGVASGISLLARQYLYFSTSKQVRLSSKASKN
jgi:hypothetical protein